MTREPGAADAAAENHASGTGDRTALLPRRLRRSALAAGILAVAIALAGLPLYVFPPTAEPAPADLVYVIGPPVHTRTDLQARLLDEGLAPRGLISVPPPDGAAPASASDIPACQDPRIACLTPEPFTTAGEALLLKGYAADQGVERTIVITFTPHVARTRYIFDTCYPGDVTVVAVDPQLTPWEWAYQYAYQTGAFVKAVLAPCA